jgi:hypothetical protein
MRSHGKPFSRELENLWIRLVALENIAACLHCQRMFLLVTAYLQQRGFPPVMASSRKTVYRERLFDDLTRPERLVQQA